MTDIHNDRTLHPRVPPDPELRVETGVPESARVRPKVSTEEGIWTSRRRQLRDTLEQEDDTVGGLYGRAIDALGEQPLTPPALVIASHCIREMANRLPRVLEDGEAPKFEGESGEADRLERALDAFDTTGTDEAQDEVVASARGWVTFQREASARSVQMRAALVQGAADPSGSLSTVKALQTAVYAFEAYRHPQQIKMSSWPTTVQGRILDDLEVLEGVLDSRLGRFFDVVDDLSDVHALANTRHEEHWVAPDGPLVRSAIARIADPQHRRVFFRGLHNPLWMSVLDSRGVFDDPPTHSPNSDGSVSYQSWPQGDYLRMMAAEAPAEAAQILARVFPDDAAWSVQELVVTVASEVPADAAEILLPCVTKCVNSGVITRFMGIDAITVVEILANGSKRQRKKAKTLARLLLVPFRDPNGRDEPLLGRYEVLAHVDGHDYADAVARVVAAFGSSVEILNSLIWWLGEEQEQSGAYVPDEDEHDFSTIRRPSIPDHGQNSRYDEIPNVLIDAVRDCAIALLTGPERPPADLVLNGIEKAPAPIMRRIELYVLSRGVADTASSELGVDGAILVRAVRHLHDPELAQGRSLFREWHQLAAATLPHLDEAQYQLWEDLALDRGAMSPEMKARIFDNTPGAATEEEAVLDFVERRELHRLEAVGAEALRGRALTRHHELRSKYGPTEHPDFEAWRSGWRSEPEVPSELTGLAPEKVLEQLSEYGMIEADGSHDIRRLRDRERVANDFARAVTENPGPFCERSDAILALAPDLIRGFISGVTESVRRAEQTIDETENASTATEDVETNASGTPMITRAQWTMLIDDLLSSTSWRQATPSVDWRADPWRMVREDICTLLERGAAGAIPSDLLERALQVATLMTGDRDPTPEREDTYGDASSTDALSYSADTVRSSAVRASLRVLAAYVNTKSPPDGESDTGTEVVRDATHDPVVSGFLRVLSRKLTPTRDPSMAVAAVLGEHLGWLITHAPSWVSTHSSFLTTPDPFGDVLVSTALACHSPNLVTADVLRPAVEHMLIRIGGGEEIKGYDGYKASVAELVGGHLSTMVLWGLIDLDHPLLAAYNEHAPVSARASVLGETGSQLARTATLSDATRDRAMRMWDSRLAAVRAGDSTYVELAEFESWVRCKHLPTSWWLPRVVELAENGAGSGLDRVGEQLATVRDEHLETAVHALDLLIREGLRASGRIRYHLRTHGPGLLERALESGDDDLALAADKVLNFTARNGGIFIDDRLTELAKRVARNR